MSQHGYPERAARVRGAGKACAGAPATIEVLVETLTGSAFEMTVSPLDTVLAIKSKIFRVEGIPISQQHLLYNLKELDNSSSLQEHCIDDGATLRLVLSMRGGPISMHKLPLPASDEAHWRDIKELVESERDEGDWVPAGSKVTVLLFREGDNVNMIRVVENEDGTYSPLAGRASYNAECGTPRRMSPGAAEDNAVTMSKMLELRRRMESLTIQPSTTSTEDAADTLQKTRSEELLAPAGLLGADGPDACPLLDGHYTRYDYEYTLLPPTADSEQSSSEDDHVSLSGERLKLSDALAGSILVKRGGGGGGGGARDEDTIAEEGECAVESRLAKKLMTVPAAEYGPLVGGEMSSTWRVRRTFGSSSQLAPPAPLAPAHSASSLRPPLHPPPPLPLSDGLFSSSTSDLEKLKRGRVLPTLCRHRNRENLDVSDERLDRPATHSLEVGSERRHRRIKKIAELQRAEATAYHLERSYESAIRKLPNDVVYEALPKNVVYEALPKNVVYERITTARRVEPLPVDAPAPEEQPKKKIRCGFCRKRLSIATIHKCRCGGEYCAPHRYAEVHGCAYDYKATAHQYLQRANPLVSAPKLPKI